MIAVGFMLLFGTLFIAAVWGDVIPKGRGWESVFGGLFLVGLLLLAAGVAKWLWMVAP